ncbi:MAG: M48 family metallopeptidase [Lachnospiraceae bacterium]
MAINRKAEDREIRYGNTVIPYRLIRSKRGSYSIQISVEKGVIVRSPMRTSELFLQRMLDEKENWIRRKYEEVCACRERMLHSVYTPEEQEELKKIYVRAAKDYFPKRVWYYVNQITWDPDELLPETGLPYRTISIRDQKTRWGSCSGRGTLSFNWRLMLVPPRVLDYVVVHELCHIKHMNHSPEFWKQVESVMPDYQERRRWLKEHGNELYF